MIKEQLLSNLSTYMGRVNSNIELFNHHAKNAVERLNYRGDNVNGLPMKLFKGYKTCGETSFVDYINKKEEYYLDGTDIESDNLMLLAF